MKTTRRPLFVALAMVIGLAALAGQAEAQMMTIGIREPVAGNPMCTVKVTLNVVDASGTTLASFFPTNGIYNFTMPANSNADKRVTLQFQRVAGATNLTIEGVNGAFTGSQKMDVVLPK